MDPKPGNQLSYFEKMSPKKKDYWAKTFNLEDSLVRIVLE